MKILRDAFSVSLWVNHAVTGEEEVCPNTSMVQEASPSVITANPAVPTVRSQRNVVQTTRDGDQHLLKVYRRSSSPNSCVVDVFELFEPVDLELGLGHQNQKHAADYAYSPIVFRREKIHIHEVEEAGPEWGAWWLWWIPWKDTIRDKHYKQSFYEKYDFHESFAGGSHGEVWRGKRRCRTETTCDERLIFKRLKVERGYRVLEAGLREAYFGNMLKTSHNLFTEYVEHFFGDDGELWIVFKDSGLSLRGYIYEAVEAGDYVMYQHSWLWTWIRSNLRKWAGFSIASSSAEVNDTDEDMLDAAVGHQLIGTILRQILESAAALHATGIVHRDIKPSNIMCQSNFVLNRTASSLETGDVQIDCVLGDFSSAFDVFTGENFYTRGPSRWEQTDEYAPPEAIFGSAYRKSFISPSFDSWSIGIVALELLLGTPHVFSVDQRTRTVLTYKLQKAGVKSEGIEKAMYLAALSQFCIYNPSNQSKPEWPLRNGDPLHQSAMTKQSCTLVDFHRALRARDPLGWGFETSDDLLQLIWMLLAWDPRERITPAEALKHPYFQRLNPASDMPGDHNALESQMLDPRMDFDVSNEVEDFICPKCGRSFRDWHSCHTHANSRRHARFCRYNHTNLPTCLNAHAMLPTHSFSGYCDIQGRRPTIEDFHAIHLTPSIQFYGIFDGHLGNAASKYAASTLFQELAPKLTQHLGPRTGDSWKAEMIKHSTEAVQSVHDNFLKAISEAPHGFMDQSGSTATALLVTDDFHLVVSLGDSRAVLSSREGNVLKPIQMTTDHVAKDPLEQELVKARGGTIEDRSVLSRVGGVLAITRSIGDADLSPFLSREPHVTVMTRSEILELCGTSHETQPCFMILASDGLWDTVSNDDAVHLVAEVVESSIESSSTSWRESTALQHAAEALVHEAYIRGSTDNIGVVVVAIDPHLP